MIDYFYDVDERDAMFFYRETPLDKEKSSQVPLRVFGFANVKRGGGGWRWEQLYMLEICYLYLTLLTRPHQIKKAREAPSFLFFSFLFIFQTATRVGEVEKGYSCDA